MDRDNFPVTRRYVRIAVNIPVTLVLEPEGKKIKYPCSMLDVADGGVKLWAEIPVSVGQIVDVIPAEGANSPSAAVLYGWVSRVLNRKTGWGPNFSVPSPQRPGV